MKELPALDTPADNMLGRRPYDECIDWVADLLDDAATRLPATRNSSDYGRATSVIAKSLKARMLLYAASPLFNEILITQTLRTRTANNSCRPLIRKKKTNVQQTQHGKLFRLRNQDFR